MIDSSCSTVFTTTSAKIIDVVDVIEVGDNLAVVGYGRTKTKFSPTSNPEYCNKTSQFGDVTALNNAYLSTEDYPGEHGITVTRSFLG